MKKSAFAAFGAVALAATMALAGNSNIGQYYIEMPWADFYAVTNRGDSGSAPKNQRGCTVKFKYPSDSSYRFNLTAALRCHGGAATYQNPKRSFRIKFLREYGPARLNYPIFERAPVNASSAARSGYDQIILRSGGNDVWNPNIWWKVGPTFLADEWTRATQIAMSGLGSHGTWANLYVNGSYYGLFNVAERADRAWAQQYLGSAKDDWVSSREQMRGHDPYPITSHGFDLSRWNSALSRAGGAASRTESDLRLYWDFESFADYMMLGFYGAAFDWNAKNLFNLTLKTGKTYYIWNDAELCFSMVKTNPHKVQTDRYKLAWDLWPEKDPAVAHFWVFDQLMKNAAFKKVFSDRAKMHLGPGGALSQSVAQGRWDTLKNFIANDLAADASRWNGDFSTWNSNCAAVRSRIATSAQTALSVFQSKGWILPDAPTTPAAPSSLAAAAQSSTSIRLTWTDNSSNETQFKVERSATGTSGWSQIATPGANATTYTDSGLGPATKHYYRVRASNSAGDSPYSNIASATTGESAPAAPGSLAAAALSTTSIRLTWADNSSNETGFKIDRRMTGASTWERIATPAANATAYT
ncbi:MAG: CotH kinase family protein, partial [Kiritimatiellae bacterium]|nr:CotH kinase family protein [Kiritimatiellia bacterium]